MARIDMKGAGGAQQDEAAQDAPRQTFSAESGPVVTVPGNDYVTNAEMTREGADLVLRAPDGSEVVVEGYFTADPAPVITSAEGASLTPALVRSFAHGAEPVQHAAAESASDESPVGHARDVHGEATITRTDGSTEPLAEGTPVYQGDVIETAADGAVDIVFIDETSFAVSRNAKLAIDQYVYDPATESGETNFSVLRGLFVFTSGLIGRDDPDDVKIETPMGSIGIRGTIIAGDADAGTVTVVEGAIVLRALGGQEVTLAERFESARFAPGGSGVENTGVQTPETLSGDFGTLSGVLPTFFNTLGAENVPPPGDAPAQQDDGTQAPSDAVDGKPAEEGAPETLLEPGQTDPATAEAPPQLPPPPVPNFLQGIDSSVPVYAPPPPPGGVLAGAGILPPPLPPGSTFNVPPPPPPPGANMAPGGTTGGGTAGNAPPPPLVLDINAGPIPDDASSGDIVATVKTTVPFLSVSFALTTNGPFQLVQVAPDRAVIVYTGGGTLTEGDSYGFSVTATLPDGRQTSFNYARLVVEPFEDALDIGQAGAPGVHLVASGNGAGVSVGRIGDTDGDGLREVGLVTRSGAAGEIKVMEWTGSSFVNLATVATGVGSDPDMFDDMVFSGLGDINGDGKDDYAVGSPLSGSFSDGDFRLFSGINPGSTQRGLDLGAPDGGENYGWEIKGAGDVNNDGIADILVSAPFEDGAASFSGTAYLLFGGTNFFAGGAIDPADIGSTVPGIVVNGLASGDEFGYSVSAASDVNDDGINDFVVGAPGANGKGEAYVLFGQAGTSWSGYNLSTAGNYLKITGSGLAAGSDLGGHVQGLGDFNGDGKGDLMVAATEETLGGDGKLFVVYGGLGVGSFDVGALDGNNGFTIDGTNSEGLEILGGGAVGDFNGDGRDDFAVIFGDGAGINDIYIVYGRGAGMPATLTYDDLNNPTKAFSLIWDGPDGETIEIVSAGDVNGDGRDDFVIGSDDADFGNGEVYLIEGRSAVGAPPTLFLTAPGNLTASAAGQSLVGSTGADGLNDGGVAGVSMKGGGGSDMLAALSGGLRLAHGGAAVDTLSLVTNSMVLNFSSTGGAQIAEIERLRFQGVGQTLRLGIEDVFQLLQDSADGKLRIFNDVGATSNTLQIDDNGAGSGSLAGALGALGFTAGTPGPYGDAGINYDAYNYGGYTLLVDQTISAATVV